MRSVVIDFKAVPCAQAVWSDAWSVGVRLPAVLVDTMGINVFHGRDFLLKVFAASTRSYGLWGYNSLQLVALKALARFWGGNSILGVQSKGTRLRSFSQALVPETVEIPCWVLRDMLQAKWSCTSLSLGAEAGQMGWPLYCLLLGSRCLAGPETRYCGMGLLWFVVNCGLYSILFCM